MRFIPTRLHGHADYAVASLLIVLPLFMLFFDGPGPAAPGFDPWRAAAWCLIGPGLAVFGLALFTRYERGVMGLVPMPVHLWFDAGVGVFLIASPWLFGFAGVIWWPHVLAGVAEIGAALTTRTRPEAPDAVAHAAR